MGRRDKEAKRARTKQITLYFTISEDLSDRMDALRAKVQGRNPYNPTPMAHLCRRLLEAGLPVISAEEDRMSQAMS